MRPRGSLFPLSRIAIALVALLAGCSLISAPTPNLTPTSIETVEYYPRLVKGYQNSYPERRIIVLTPVDARTFNDAEGADHSALEGNPAIGVVVDRDKHVLQRLFS